MLELKRKLFNVEEYYQMAEVGILKPSDRVELLNGEIVDMSPINSFHASVTDRLYELIMTALVGKAIVRGQNPIQLNEQSMPEPDIAVVQFRKDRYRQAHPTAEAIHWLIEVSDTTLLKDQTIKKELYAKAGIPVYWIVNLEEESVEVYEKIENGQYQLKSTFGKNDRLPFPNFDFSLNVHDLFE